MATIFIHHHVADRFAAEVLAGAMLSICTVGLVAYPTGPQRFLRVEPDEAIENIVLWTSDAAGDYGMRMTVAEFARRRAPFLLLTHGDAEEPEKIGQGVAMPCFDPSTPWPAYRAALRDVVLHRLGLGEPPAKRPDPVMPHVPLIARFNQYRDPDRFPVTLVLILGAATLWALLR